jgi:hypothetical protein
MTKSTAMESTLTQTEDHTRVSGQTANSMAKVFSSRLKVPREKESGTRARGSIGSTMKNKSNPINTCKIKISTDHAFLII